MNISRAMGWRYEWVDQLPRVVYDTLVADLNRSTAEGG